MALRGRLKPAPMSAVRTRIEGEQAATFGSNAVKDVAGYDLKRLYIGSDAVFGTVRETTLKIAPQRR